MNSIIINNPPDIQPQDVTKAVCAFGVQVEDHIEHALDLNKYLIRHPAATFFMRASGNNMAACGIVDGDLLIIDRALTPQNNSLVVLILNGEFCIKRIRKVSNKIFLYSGRNTKPCAVSEVTQLQIWGVVTHAIHAVCPS